MSDVKFAITLAFLLLFIHTNGTGMESSFSQQALSYSIHASMSSREVVPVLERRVNVTFTVSGVGDFLNASVEVDSDSANLLVNTFKLQALYAGTDGRMYEWLDKYALVNHDERTESVRFSFRGINCEWIDYDVCSRYSQYSSTISMLGSILLDSSSTDLGAHRIKVIFIARTAVGNVEFSDSLSYDVLELWQMNPQALGILAGLIFVIAAGTYLFARSRKKRKDLRSMRGERRRETVHSISARCRQESSRPIFRGSSEHVHHWADDRFHCLVISLLVCVVLMVRPPPPP